MFVGIGKSTQKDEENTPSYLINKTQVLANSHGLTVVKIVKGSYGFGSSRQDVDWAVQREGKLHALRLLPGGGLLTEPQQQEGIPARSSQVMSLDSSVS
ncbi:Methylcytosine Dioxygenase Tet3 [Manis pentadactyla]|nr:Methylcytosine Dioxygenase Tet3 [Manis pentadactyla]